MTTASPATRPANESAVRRFRNRWNELSRPQQWVALIPLVVLIYLIPEINAPILASSSVDFATSMFHAAEFAMIALGLNVVVGQAGLLDLGYVGFFAIGSYVAALLTSPESMLAKIPYLATLPIAMVVTMVFGLILGTPTLRLRGDYLAIVTLGFGEIVRLLASIIPIFNGNVGLNNVGHPPKLLGQTFSNTDAKPWYWLMVTLIIVILLFVGNLERSRVGRAWVAIREDEDAAQIMGVSTFKFKLWAFAIGAAIGGLSGALVGGQVSFVNNQDFSVPFSVLYLAAVILGGAGNKVGVMIGGFLVSYIPDRFNSLGDKKYLVFGVALVLLMIFRSQGLLGARQRLLARGRQAYRQLLGRPEPILSESSVTPDGGAR